MTSYSRRYYPCASRRFPIPGRAPQNQFPLHKINIRAGTLFKLQITCNSITLLQGQGPSPD